MTLLQTYFKVVGIPCILAEVHTIPGRDYARARGSRSRVYSLIGEAIAPAPPGASRPSERLQMEPGRAIRLLALLKTHVLRR